MTEFHQWYQDLAAERAIKALKENPWNEFEGKLKKGDIISGVVIKFNKHGALASIEEGIAGLVHVSEFGTDEKLKATLELGKRYPFTISSTVMRTDSARDGRSYPPSRTNTAGQDAEQCRMLRTMPLIPSWETRMFA